MSIILHFYPSEGYLPRDIIGKVIYIIVCIKKYKITALNYFSTKAGSVSKVNVLIFILFKMIKEVVYTKCSPNMYFGSRMGTKSCIETFWNPSRIFVKVSPNNRFYWKKGSNDLFTVCQVKLGLGILCDSVYNEFP